MFLAHRNAKKVYGLCAAKGAGERQDTSGARAEWGLNRGTFLYDGYVVGVAQ